MRETDMQCHSLQSDHVLQLSNSGKVVKDSENFQDERFIWPEGYTALRTFPSITGCSFVKVLLSNFMLFIDY